VMRLAPAPLYNSFLDVFRFVEELRRAFDDLEAEVEDEVGVEEQTKATQAAAGIALSEATADNKLNWTKLNGTLS